MENVDGREDKGMGIEDVKKRNYKHRGRPFGSRLVNGKLVRFDTVNGTMISSSTKELQKEEPKEPFSSSRKEAIVNAITKNLCNGADLNASIFGR